MRRLASLGLLLVIPALAACTEHSQPTAPRAPAVAATMGIEAAAPVTVMTQNLYLGADLDGLLDPTAPIDSVIAAILTQLAYTDYPARAAHLAAEIAAKNPAAVGLQEVTTYVYYTPGGTIAINFLQILQSYLTALGADYDVAVYQPGLSLVIPVGAVTLDSVKYTDGDAILVRHDAATSWSEPTAEHFSAQATLPLPGGGGVPNLHGWLSVAVQTEGLTFRFVDTHLEVQYFRDTQEAQALELVTALQGDSLPVILVGDFNSAANPLAPATSKTGSYHTLIQAGYADLELRQPYSVDLLTCCQSPDLSNSVTSFDQRLDLILARFGAAGFGGQSAIAVVGASSSDRFTVPSAGYDLWPSDHAGVFAELWPAPGIASR